MSPTGQFPRTKTTVGLGALTEVRVPAVVVALPGTHKAFRAQSGCHVMVAVEPARAAPEGIWLPEAAKMLWHLSISHPHRYPTWDEIADARYGLCPDEITMALLLPPQDEYVNVHEHVFHLWQIDDRRADQ